MLGSRCMEDGKFKSAKADIRGSSAHHCCPQVLLAHCQIITDKLADCQ